MVVPLPTGRQAQGGRAESALENRRILPDTESVSNLFKILQSKPWENGKVSPVVCVGKCSACAEEEVDFEEELEALLCKEEDDE